MTTQEAAAVVAHVRLKWPHSQLGDDPREVVTSWHDILADVDQADALAAIRELVVSGREHAPPVGLVLKTAADRALGVPSWDVVWPELERKVSECITVRGFRIPKAEEFSHPYVGEFARLHWRSLCPPPREADMGTYRAQLRDWYRTGAARAERDVALAAVGAGRAPAVRAGEPRRLGAGSVG